MPPGITTNEILDEVARLAAEGPVVAAFDADGTLWSGDVGETVFARGRSLVDDQTLTGPVRAFAERWQLDFGESADEVWQRLKAYALADGMGTGLGDASDALLIDLYALESWVFAGRSEAEMTAFADTLFEERLAATIFSEMRALVDGLQAAGARVLVLSGSLRGIVLAGTRRLGIDDDNVFGTEPDVEDGRYLPSAVTMFGDEKGARLDAVRGAARVAAAFGDAPAGNDRALLERAALPVVINPRGRHRVYARDHGRMRALWVGDGQVKAE